MFKDFCNDKIYILKQDGSETGPHDSTFGDGKFVIFDESIDVDEGDFVDRPLPNGKRERFDIIEVKFANKFHDIPGHFDLEVRKQGRLITPESRQTVTNISVNNSQGFQIGDHDTQNIVDSFKEIVERIDNSNSNEEEKKEAKSKLKEFLSHPLTGKIIGSAIGGLIATL